jgi:hypothetical protein
MERPERLAGVRGEYVYDTLLPALRGHLGIHAGDLVALARAHGLVVPTGEPGARGPEWLALLEALAGVTPLAAAAGKTIGLLPVIRDLTDLVEGPVAPVAWWQRLFGGSGAKRAAPDPRLGRLLDLLRKLADGLELPPELVRPLLGCFSGVLTEAETRELADLLAAIGRETWLAWAERGVNRAAWPACYDVLAPAAREAADRGLGLLYGAGY